MPDHGHGPSDFQRKSSTQSSAVSLIPKSLTPRICNCLALQKPSLQLRRVRGSPVFRFIFLAIALMITAAGLQRVTSARPEQAPPIFREKPKPTASAVPFRLVLSAPAAAVEIDTGKPLQLSSQEMPISGTLEMDLTHPQLALVVRWRNPPTAGEHRFAKLTLEIPRQPTFTHVFDADGDIDDFLELPLPTSHE